MESLLSINEKYAGSSVDAAGGIGGSVGSGDEPEK
jgi:hypothetical protein